MRRGVPAAIVLVLLFCGSPLHAQPRPNAISIENAQPGTSTWNVRNGAGAGVYASEISAEPGDDVHFHVSIGDRYRLVVYRLGWYGGAGARLMACVPSCSGSEEGHVLEGQDPPAVQPLRANWPVTDVVHTGTDWVSGYYIAEAVALGGQQRGQVADAYFILRQRADAPPSQILVQVPVNTWEAYNDWGGRGLYDIVSPRASRVSFQRPLGGNAQFPLWTEIQTVRFLEREGYDVSYQTDVDTDADPSSLLRHRLVIVNGHDEYWTDGIRTAFDSAVAGGTNLAFMGSNDAYWRIQYEEGRQTIFTTKLPGDLFRVEGKPECALIGEHHTGLTVYDHPLDYTVTAAGAADPWLANTGLTAGSVIQGVVGREHDGIVPGCSPANTVSLFHYSDPNGGQSADATRYTAPSGARVFASGGYQFSHALDDYRETFYTPGSVQPVGGDRSVAVDTRMQQFMRNALSDLTAPAAPATVRKVSDGGQLRVRTGWPVDARVVGRLVWRVRLDDGTRTLVCSGRAPCFPGRASGPGTYRFDVSYVDRWGGVSAATSSTPWTWHP